VLLVVRRDAGDPALQQGIVGDLGLSILPFIGVLVPTIILALQGARSLLVAPYLIETIAKPILTYPDRLPRPLGLGWTPALTTPSTSPAWVYRPLIGVIIDGVFILAPALWIARAGTVVRGAPRPSVAMRFGSLAFVLFALLVYVHVAQVTGAIDTTSRFTIARIGWYLLLGALAGRSTTRVRWLVLLAPVALDADSVQLLLPIPFSLPRFLSPALPALIAAVAGLLWMPLAGWFDRLRGLSARALLASVLLLNLADVLFTLALTRVDGAVEANPVVRALGLPAKLALVSIAAFIVARVRPAGLVWPVIVMLAVTAWQIGGLTLAMLT